MEATLETLSINGKMLTKEQIDKAKENHVTVNIIRDRVHNYAKTIDEAVSTPVLKQGEARKKSMFGLNMPGSTKGMVTYHLPLEEVWAKYGKPGHIMHPERLKNNSHWG